MGGLSFDLLAKLTGKKFSVSAVRVKKFCATTQFDATADSVPEQRCIELVEMSKGKHRLHCQKVFGS